MRSAALIASSISIVRPSSSSRNSAVAAAVADDLLLKYVAKKATGSAVLAGPARKNSLAAPVSACSTSSIFRFSSWILEETPIGAAGAVGAGGAGDADGRAGGRWLRGETQGMLSPATLSTSFMSFSPATLAASRPWCICFSSPVICFSKGNSGGPAGAAAAGDATGVGDSLGSSSLRLMLAEVQSHSRPRRQIGNQPSAKFCLDRRPRCRLGIKRSALIPCVTVIGGIYKGVYSARSRFGLYKGVLCTYKYQFYYTPWAPTPR